MGTAHKQCPASGLGPFTLERERVPIGIDISSGIIKYVHSVLKNMNYMPEKARRQSTPHASTVCEDSDDAHTSIHIQARRLLFDGLSASPENRMSGSFGANVFTFAAKRARPPTGSTPSRGVTLYT